jgi:hypothetical protein
MVEIFLDELIANKNPIVIPCKDKSHQMSIRTQLFRAKKKLPNVVADVIRITNNSDEGKLFVRIALQTAPEAFREMEDGTLVPIVFERKDEEQERLIRLMKEDGMSDEEIQKYLEEKEGMIL